MCRHPHDALRGRGLCMQGSGGAWGEKRHTLKALVYLISMLERERETYLFKTRHSKANLSYLSDPLIESISTWEAVDGVSEPLEVRGNSPSLLQT